MDEATKAILAHVTEGAVLFNQSLAKFSSFAIGGPADALVIVNKRRALIPLLQCLEREEIGWRVIGKGSNLLIRDEGYRGLVIILGEEFSQIGPAEINDGDTSLNLFVGAGCSLTKLNHHCSRQGYGGLTFSYGIPGSVGGALLMNAGAWGQEMASVVDEVEVMSAQASEMLKGEQLDFSYRKWPYFNNYKGKGVITGVQLRLILQESRFVCYEMKQLLQKRKESQPHNYPNGGSCFKNPAGKSAGQLIEECGLKGESVGGAMVSPKHANFIINVNKATAKDVLTLLDRVKETVLNRFGINLEPELHVM